MYGAGTTLKSSGTHGSWDAAAASSECIESLHSLRRGLRCKLSDAPRSCCGQSFMIGFMCAASCPKQAALKDNLRHRPITYAAFISRGSFSASAGGKSIGQCGGLKAGDTLEIRLTTEDLPRIEYCVNGETRFTTTKGTLVQVPLFAKVYAFCQCPLVEDLQWIFESAS